MDVFGSDEKNSAIDDHVEVGDCLETGWRLAGE